MNSYICVCCDKEFASNRVIKSYEALCDLCCATHFICDRCSKIKRIISSPIRIFGHRINHICEDCCGQKCCCNLC